jgi:hypothetical protein
MAAVLSDISQIIATAGAQQSTRVVLVDSVTQTHQNVAHAKYLTATARRHAVAATVSTIWLIVSLPSKFPSTNYSSKTNAGDKNSCRSDFF